MIYNLQGWFLPFHLSKSCESAWPSLDVFLLRSQNWVLKWRPTACPATPWRTAPCCCGRRFGFEDLEGTLKSFESELGALWYACDMSRDMIDMFIIVWEHVWYCIHFTGTKNLALALEFGSNLYISDYRRMMWAMTSLPRLVEYTGWISHSPCGWWRSSECRCFRTGCLFRWMYFCDW